MGKSSAVCAAWVAVALVLSVFSPAGIAFAEDAAAPATQESAPGRFTMVPAEGGFVRLDTRTGAVSHCRRESGEANAAWRCALIPEEELSRPDRLAELDRKVDALGRGLADLQARLAAIEAEARQRASAKVEAPPTDEEMNRALDFSEELMRRFLGLVQEMKREDQGGRS